MAVQPDFCWKGSEILKLGFLKIVLIYESRHEKTSDFCKCENKGADQLRIKCGSQSATAKLISTFDFTT